MNRLSVFGDSSICADHLRAQLSGILEITFRPVGEIVDAAPDQCMLFDFDLNQVPHLVLLKEWLRHKPSGAKVIFVTDRGSWLQKARAFALGATDVLHRPIDGHTLLTRLWGDVAILSDPSNTAIQKSPAVAAAVDSLQNIFSSASLGAPLDSPAIQSAGETVVSQLEAQGLAAWIDTVRTHHSQTYQHCLLVTGLAVAFGQQLGLSRQDCQRLSFAGMLHDIGKARIPLAILEKPGPLNSGELTVMKEHPQYGFSALSVVPDLPTEMLDMVVHHHEYLDGSGYPHGLQGNEISDLVRIITIADVFGALIEQRAYKPPLSNDDAFQVLLDMGPKLDKDLVREFRFAAWAGQNS